MPDPESTAQPSSFVHTPANLVGDRADERGDALAAAMGGLTAGATPVDDAGRRPGDTDDLADPWASDAGVYDAWLDTLDSPAVPRDTRSTPGI